jgi:aminoglycoside phosphotransferase family enzyme/gluconate kinase
MEFRLIETHISWVLLTGMYAYKIVKPLNLGFLDFSDLEKRYRYCFEELRLNRRLAGTLYVEVVPICGTAVQPCLGGYGPAFEYSIKMRQFEQHAIFEQLLEDDQLTTMLVKRAAEKIAHFHRTLICSPDGAVYGTPDEVLKPVRENFDQLEQIDNIGKNDVLQELANWSEQEFRSASSLLRERKSAGFIRACHGDLHLGNIALIDGEVVPFDGIGFNPSLYWIDVISEVAFLVMDLADHQRLDLAFQFLNSYLEITGDYGGLRLLPFYLVYRAMVRAKISAIRASQETEEKAFQKDIALYHDYLELAVQYTRSRRPFLLLMHGVSASGKSWLSEQIINHVPAVRLRSDVERKRIYRLPLRGYPGTQDAEILYSSEANTKTYIRLLQLTRGILQAGCNVIVDAAFLKKEERRIFLQLGEEQNLPVHIVSTTGSREILLQRLRRRARERDNVSDADQLVLEEQLRTREPLTAEERQKAIIIDTENTEQVNSLWQAGGKGLRIFSSPEGD